MQFVPARPNHAAKMEPLIEKRQGLTLRLLVGFIISYKLFNLLRK